MGPDQSAPRATRTPGAQDHRPGGEPAAPQKAESEPSQHAPTNENPPRGERERPRPFPVPCFGREMNGRKAGIGRDRRVRLAGRTKAEPVAERGHSAGRERSAPGTLQPTTGHQTRPAPWAATLTPRKLLASPGAVPAVGVDALEGGGGGHGAEERGRLARSKALKESGPRGTELPTQKPATAAGASAVACRPDHRFYRARKHPPPPRRHWPIQMNLFTPIGSLECQVSCGVTMG